MPRGQSPKNNSAANLRFEAKLWHMAEHFFRDMSRAKWATWIAFLVGLIANITPIPSTLRWILSASAAIGLAVCLIGYCVSHHYVQAALKTVHPVARPILLAITALAVCGIIGGIGWKVWQMAREQERGSLANNAATSNPPGLASQEGDFIEGTIVTHHDLEKRFPFGYIVFSKKSGIWTHSPPPSLEKMRWTANWDEVRIEPNFTDGTVKWIIPDFQSTNTGLQYRDNSPAEFTGTLELKKMIVTGYLFSRNQPMPCLVTLNSDQRFPVFLLGFFIPDPHKMQSVNSPDSISPSSGD